MCGGGTQTTTQQVSIPPEVMARYNSVNARAEGVSNQPFQQYGGEFVAPLTEVQQQGIQATSDASQSAQPYYQMGTGLTLAGTQAVGPLTSGQISTYMNPYIEGVVDPTLRALQQQQGQQLSQQQADAIKGGAFGGERSGIQRAMLQGQQNLATGQAIAPLYAQGYQQAVQTATGQQGVRAQDLARLAQAGQQIAGLGTGAQGAALQGAQAQIAAGTLGQQTRQAQDTAQYQQFLQERGYPYQQAQFLANIAMGTGALSGSTTTTESPAGFFSDKRLKENVKVVGETNDGQPIYRYNYKGEKKTQLGLIAQEVEKDHPEAVGESQGYKTVDYKKATDDSVRHHRAYGGGLDVNAFGGAVTEPGSYAGGGLVDSTDLSAILAQQKNFFGPYGKGLAGEGSIGGASGIPAANLAVPKLVTASGMPQQQRSGLSQAAETGSSIAGLYKSGKSALVGDKGEKGLIGNDGKMGDGYLKDLTNLFSSPRAHGGGVMPHGYAVGGEINPYALSADPMADVVQEGTQKAPELTKPGQAPGVKSPASDVKDAVGLAGSVASAGTAIAQFLPMLLAMSDERMKDNKEKIGKLFDGQPVYRYDFGDGNTQIGLMAQNVEKSHPEAVHETSSGIKMVNYDAATRDAANDRHGYAFGGMPPQGYATRGGVPDMPDDEYAIRTIAAEAGGTEDARAIADVINNRRQAGRWGDSYRDVVTAHKQFEPWGNPQGANYPMNFAADSPRMKNASEAFQATLGGEDTTGGALHFYGRQAQEQLAKTKGDRGVLPSWFDPSMDYTDFGPTRVVRGVDAGTPRGVRAFAADQPQGEAQKSIGAALKAGTGPEADTLFGGIKKALPTQKDSSGKESTNWEKVLIPLLSGVGSALSSQRNTLGGALGEGLLGGVGGYQSISKMQADIPETVAKTQVDLANADRINMLTRVSRAGMLEVKSTQGIGVQVIDKENPGVPVTIIDANGKVVPGAEELLAKAKRDNPTFNFSIPARDSQLAALNKTEDTTAAKPQQPPMPGGVDDPATKLENFKPAPVPLTEWEPVTRMPEGYTPVGQFLKINAYTTPEEKAAKMAPGLRAAEEMKAKASSVPGAQFLIDTMAKDVKTSNTNSFTAPGMTGEMRNKIASYLNDLAGVTGLTKAIDPANVAAFEGIQKGTIRLGYSTTNDVTNSRIPFEFVKSAIQANPSIANSPLGAYMLLRNNEQAKQMLSDQAEFYTNYVSKYGHTDGAEKAFKAWNDPQKYVDRGVLKATEDFIPKEAQDALRQRVAQYGKEFPIAMQRDKKAFDDIYFKGASKILLGE